MPRAANVSTQRRNRNNLPQSSTLFEIHTTLHLLYHRNKNQHRCAKWFKSLAMLRRDTQKLACEIEKIEERDNLDYDYSEEEQESVAGKLIAHLGREVIPRSYRAFSTVVADTQFSALGVVLIALLSRLSKVIGAAEYFPHAEETSPQSEAPDDTTTHAATSKLASGSVVTEDLGEAVARNGHGVPAGIGEDVVAAPVGELRKSKDKKGPAAEYESAAASDNLALGNGKAGQLDQAREKTSKKKKKKKRKGNAIDDIFGDL